MFNYVLMDGEKRQQILTSALEAFFKHGYKRISMKEIAEFAGVSRTSLYMDFKDKEEVLKAAIRYYSETLITEIEDGIQHKKTTEEKILFAFEVWSIRNFDAHMASPETREIVEGYLSFAQESFDESYKKLEDLIISVLKKHFADSEVRKVLSADRTAHVLVAASKGFKLVARSGAELRKLVQDMLKITLLP